MAQIEEAISALLRAYAPLTALVGQRIFPNVLREGTEHPAIAFFRVSGARLHSLTGRSGLATARMQFDCFAKGVQGYSDVKRVGNQVRRALDGYKGNVAVGPEVVRIEHILLDDEQDIFTANFEVHGVTLDFMIMYQET